MGAIAQAIATYAQPLLEGTDGTHEDWNRAMALSQLCWNIALLRPVSREEALEDLRSSTEMEPEEFADFRRSVLLPMLRRHEEMFPELHRRCHEGSAEMAPKERYPGTEPYAPCPCNSGRKYKFCCRAKGR
jgi:uncharacterized protein YecA (UPF0149 family)